ncbi:MAG: cation transporter [Bacteriovoracaceae bacterium]|nr:cation transporter [Bacteriovoracaceae bacterium]
MNEQKTVIRVTAWGMISNLLLAGIKYFLGVVGGSSALIADAIHSLSDIVSDMAIILGVRFWTQPADEGHQHGHKKAELLASLFIGVLLFSVGAGIVYDSIVDIKEGHSAPPKMIALIAAVASIIIKELLYRWTLWEARRIHSSALIANAWHHRSDAISSIPVAISIIVSSLYPSWSFVDLIGAVFVAAFIIQASYRIIKEALDTLLDASAPKETLAAIRSVTKSVDEVKGVHSMRTRYLGSSSISVDFHLEVDPNMLVKDADVIAHKVEDKLMATVEGVVDVVIHVDPHKSK